MRLVRYRMAASLDGFIAGRNGETDWIVRDPATDWAEVYAGFDTVLLGRRTYEVTRQPGAPAWPADWRIYVFSRTLDPAIDPAITVVNTDAAAAVAALRAETGRDIWLFGGGSLFASLLRADLVDRLELAIMPVLLGGGIPLVAREASHVPLKLARSHVSDAGIIHLDYDVQGADGQRVVPD